MFASGAGGPRTTAPIEAYNYEVGIKPLLNKALGVQTLREDRENETEFMTISCWESVEAMSTFTGGDPTQVHHLERDEEFLIELPKGGADPAPPHEPWRNRLHVMKRAVHSECRFRSSSFD